MKAVPIDDYLEAVEAGRTPEVPPLGRHSGDHWGRIVEEARRARMAADGGRWRVGQLAGQVEKRYGAASLQRFAEEIGESYSTVRRYRWVAGSYDSSDRFKFPSLSFSHFQAVAKLHDRNSWLQRAERGGWSVDRLTAASHGQAPSSESGIDACTRLNSCIESMRRQISTLSAIEARALSESDRVRAANALIEFASEIRSLQKKLTSVAHRPTHARPRR